MTYVAKDNMRVRIYIGTWQVECEFYFLVDSRLTDALNRKNEDFIPVTDAEVSDATTGRLLFKAPFMDLSRQGVLAVCPLDACDGEHSDPETRGNM